MKWIPPWLSGGNNSSLSSRIKEEGRKEGTCLRRRVFLSRMDEHLEIIKRKKCLRTDSKVTMRLLLSIFLLPRFRTHDESAKKAHFPLRIVLTRMKISLEMNTISWNNFWNDRFEVEKRKIEKYKTKYIRGKQRERIDSHERWKFVRWIGTRGRGL